MGLFNIFKKKEKEELYVDEKTYDINEIEDTKISEKINEQPTINDDTVIKSEELEESFNKTVNELKNNIDKNIEDNEEI